ncbi:MAG: PIN domain-containing protein [Candidatus Nanopelagicales bacterium]
MILADTSGLLSLYNRREPTHQSVAEIVAHERGPFVVSPYVVAELDYLVSTRLGADAEQRVLAELASPAYVLATVDRDDLRACAELVARYAGIGVADASMLVLADRLGIDRVLTLDRRHFEAARTPSGRALAIVP